MSGIIDNLTSAINTWNSKLAEIWLLLTESPETFKGGDIWQIIVKIHGALQAIGLALLVLFFVWGLIRTCTSWQDVKRPEQAFKEYIKLDRDKSTFKSHRDFSSEKEITFKHL